MKCDELKDYDYDPDFPFQSRGRFYVADEVDAAIDELKAVHHKERHEYIKMIAELKQKLEDAKATSYAESVDAGMENRRLKRALWLARSERARDKALIFYFAMTESFNLNINGYSTKEKGHTRMRPAKWWRLTWLKIERKCRAKAEKYK